MIHIKGRADGEIVAVMGEECSIGEELTFDELQTLLDQWIDLENVNPQLDPVSEEPIYQQYISLQSLVSYYG